MQRLQTTHGQKEHHRAREKLLLNRPPKRGGPQHNRGPIMPIRTLDDFAFIRHLFKRWDVIAGIVVIALLTFFAEASHGLFEPLGKLQSTPLSLDAVHLPFYAAPDLGSDPHLGSDLFLHPEASPWPATPERR